MSGVRKIISFGLHKSSKLIKSTYSISLLSPAVLMLTLAIMGGSATIPWSNTFSPESIIYAGTIVAVPFMLDLMASSVEKVDYKVLLKNWVRKF
jgi:ABC-type molybdate transport system permease subunit